METNEIIDVILEDRGVELLGEFLYPSEDALVPFEEMRNIDRAAQIILDGIENNKRFLVYADVDTDGCTANAIAVRWLKEHTDNVTCCINQGKEHGISKADPALFEDVDILWIVDSIETNMYPYENVTYYNIHTFITKYAAEHGDLSTPKARAQALMEIDWDKLDFDDVIIDEGQDFDNDEIIYFKDFSELVEGRFFVFYDKNQLLTTDEVPKWIRDSECKLVLTKNCRNTYEIALTSYNVIDVELNQKITMVNGDKTSISFVKGDPLMKLSRLIKYYTDDQNGYSYGDIVILSLKKEEDSILNGVHKIMGIPLSREPNNSSILFTTAIKYKGLESRVVIIIDIDEEAFGNEEKKRVFYVACSRATQRLSLFVNSDEDGVKKIADAIGVVDYLSFGSESGDISALIKASENMSSEEYKTAFLEMQKSDSAKDVGYPKLCQTVYDSLYPEDNFTFTPNNILALEYIKAITSINSTVKPHTIKRSGASFSESSLRFSSKTVGEEGYSVKVLPVFVA
jgi:hypothetical protein